MNKSSKSPACLVSRREFLFASALSVTTLMLPLPGCAPLRMQVGRHPEKRIARLSELGVQQPIYFDYPDTATNAQNVLVRLGRKAGAGVGPEQDLVAFSIICTHMGGNLYGRYLAGNASLGPCPLHLSSFDLTRHGLMITGQATESLPQILLEVRDDEIFATGVMGILYGQEEGLIAHG